MKVLIVANPDDFSAEATAVVLMKDGEAPNEVFTRWYNKTEKTDLTFEELKQFAYMRFFWYETPVEEI